MIVMRRKKKEERREKRGKKMRMSKLTSVHEFRHRNYITLVMRRLGKILSKSYVKRKRAIFIDLEKDKK